MTYVLGLNAYHGDASAALIRDGEIIAAVEEERFRRIKHWAGFPSEAIRYCLAEAGTTIRHVEHVAINSNPRANFLKKVSYALRRRPDGRVILDRVRNQSKRLSLEGELAATFPSLRFDGEVHRIEHHEAHLASAFLVSPFQEAVVASIDGFGDFCSTAWGIGSGRKIEIDGRIYFPHSLGVFYQALTQFLGFPHYGDEYKVMGLAPYGSPRYLREMREIVLLLEGGVFELNTLYFRHDSERISYNWEGGSPHVGTLFSSALEQLLGPARGKDEPLTKRHSDIAASVQAMYEEALFHLARALHAKHKIDSIALAGGCAMNSVANGKIQHFSPFTRVYIQSAPGDAGGAIGAALKVWNEISCVTAVPRVKRACALEVDAGVSRAVMDHAYLGPSYTGDEITNLLEARTRDIHGSGCQIFKMTDESSLCRRAAEAIARGDVVGWFQGRLEWGPRALGNRSIVCDPRRADMKDILNLKIKRRESFRPFAPSILREYVSEWFEEEGDVPFMMQVLQIREEKRRQIPAVTHVDGSGRLQTVHRETNRRYWMLIQAFRELTGVPIVLNTSFNENEPVVCCPEEALDCFLRTKMDMLVLGDHIIMRTL